MSGIGSEIINAIQKRSKLTATAWNMRQAINHYNYVKDRIPEAKETAKNEALKLCNEYSALAYDNSMASEADMKVCFSFWKKYAPAI